MPVFRKKPVLIEARQFDGTPFGAVAIAEWTGGKAMVKNAAAPELLIATLEGVMSASPCDWVIKGVNGEFYPCKPDVFEKTYEAA